MPAPIRVKLNQEEDRTLKELCFANGVLERTKQREFVIRLNAHGWMSPQIAQFLGWHEHTVRAALKRWETKSIGGLWEEKGRGRKRSWSEAYWQRIKQWLEEPRRYSAASCSRSGRKVYYNCR